MHFQNRTSGYSRPLRIEPGQRTTQAQRASDDDTAVAPVGGELPPKYGVLADDKPFVKKIEVRRRVEKEM
jgi:hypothetical protein